MELSSKAPLAVTRLPRTRGSTAFARSAAPESSAMRRSSKPRVTPAERRTLRTLLLAVLSRSGVEFMAFAKRKIHLILRRVCDPGNSTSARASGFAGTNEASNYVLRRRLDSRSARRNLTERYQIGRAHV